MEPYSTLEVRQVENYSSHDRNESTKETISQDPGLYEDNALFRNNDNDKYYVQGQDVETHATEGRQSSLLLAVFRTFLGLRGISKTKSYVILAVMVLVVMGAIAGGVAGSVLRRHADSKQPPNAAQDDPGGNSSSSGNNSTPKTQAHNTNVLSTSRLASSNWTDTDGVAYRTVFFQDPNNAILARRWDSENRVWTTTNVTDIVMGSDNPPPLPIPGTPLASAACSYGTVLCLQLWFLSAAEIGNATFVSGARLLRPREKPDSWEGEESYAGQRTSPGSQLSAAWQRCWSLDCIGDWVLVYQTPEGHIDVANATDWGNPERVIDRKDVAANSSLSIVPQFTTETGAVDRIALVSERVDSSSGGPMQKTMFRAGEWHSDGFLIEDLPPPSPKLQFVTVLLQNFTQTMFLALLPDDSGTVIALWWAGGWTNIPRIEFRGGPSQERGAQQNSSVKFSAISAGEDAVLYGISGDEVLAYEPDPDGDDISVFVYIGRVYP